MKNKFITVYGIIAILVLVSSIAFFAFSVIHETRAGTIEAEKSFAWISREAVSASLSDGFMTDSFIADLTEICRKSRLLSAVAINTSSGSLYAWPDNSPNIVRDLDGTARITSSSFFMKVYSASLDIGDGTSGSVVMTAALNVLLPDTIFAASRNSFIVILALLFSTIIVILLLSSAKKVSTEKSVESPVKATEPVKVIERVNATEPSAAVEQVKTAEPFKAAEPVEVQLSGASEEETIPTADDADILPDMLPIEGFDAMPQEHAGERFIDEIDDGGTAGTEHVFAKPEPEGLFSPVTGTGWEQYLTERLDAELVRAASSEQDLSLIIIRIAGLLHTDLLSRKIAQILVDTFRFRDMVFEYGSNGFAGILQNVNLDEAMKTAESLYAGIDSILMEMSCSGQITIGITTRTARLLPASRMIEEATSAAKKAEEEPTLPIVAFRANPEKYRDFVVENN